MKIECTREKIADAIYKAEKISAKNPTLPVLKCVLIEAKNNNLKIKATNLDLGIEIDIPTKTTEDAIIAVPASILNTFIQNLHNEKNITLETVENNLIVKTSTGSTVIKSLPHEDFPNIPTVPKENAFKINSKDFVKGLKSVWYSSSISTMKPELSSVYIHHEDENVVFVATDSFRLAEKRVKTKKIKDFGNILIPFRNVSEIIRVLEGIDDEIDVYVDRNQIAFSHKNVYLVSRTIDGIFPDYKQIIPKDHKTEAIVLKQDLIDTLKLSNIFSDSFNQLTVKAHPSEKKLEFRTKNSDVGESDNRTDAMLSGEDIDINFNHKYITDSFQSIDADSVSLQFNGLSKAMVIRGVSDRSFLYLVMPMNK